MAPTSRALVGLALFAAASVANCDDEAEVENRTWCSKNKDCAGDSLCKGGWCCGDAASADIKCAACFPDGDCRECKKNFLDPTKENNFKCIRDPNSKAPGGKKKKADKYTVSTTIKDTVAGSAAALVLYGIAFVAVSKLGDRKTFKNLSAAAKLVACRDLATAAISVFVAIMAAQGLLQHSAKKGLAFNNAAAVEVTPKESLWSALTLAMGTIGLNLIAVGAMYSAVAKEAGGDKLKLRIVGDILLLLLGPTVFLAKHGVLAFGIVLVAEAGTVLTGLSTALTTIKRPAGLSGSLALPGFGLFGLVPLTAAVGLVAMAPWGEFDVAKTATLAGIAALAVLKIYIGLPSGGAAAPTSTGSSSKTPKKLRKVK